GFPAFLSNYLSVFRVSDTNSRHGVIMSNRLRCPKNHRPPYPMGVKGGCSPQNMQLIVVLRVFGREVSKKDLRTYRRLVRGAERIRLSRYRLFKTQCAYFSQCGGVNVYPWATSMRLNNEPPMPKTGGLVLARS